MNYTKNMNQTITNDFHANFSFTNVTLKPTVVNTNNQWRLPYCAKVILCLVYAVIFLLGIIGNSIVIYSLGFNRRQPHRSRYGFIISLATTDLLSSVAMPFVMMNDLVSEYKWHLGEVCCAVLPAINILFLFSSAWILMAISWERWRAARYITDPELSRRTILSIVATIYVCAFFVAFPNSYYHRIINGQCYPNWPNEKAVFVYYVVFIFIALFLPLTIAGCMYLHIGLSVHSTSRQHAIRSYSEQRQKENIFLYKTMILTVTAFALLTMPYAVYVIVYMSWLTFDKATFYKNFNLMVSMNYVIFTLSAMNCCVNPLIYGKRAMGRENFCGVAICKMIKKTHFEHDVLSTVTNCVSQRTQLITRWLSNSVMIGDSVSDI